MTMRLRSGVILFAATSDPNHDQRMQRICTAYSEMGYRVEWCGRMLPASVPLSPRPFLQYRFSCIFKRGKIFYLEFNCRLFLYLLRRRPQVVWAADLDTLLAGSLFTRLSGATLVYDAHEYFTETPELMGRPISKKIWEMLAQVAIPQARIAVTVNQSLAEILGSRYRVPFLTIRNVPVNRSPSLQAATKISPPVILYQGVLNMGRGLETAITAMHRLPGVQLWLAGEGDCSSALRALVAREGLGGQVIFLGKLLPEALAALTPKVFAGINLLDGDSQSYYYSLANKTFDYVQAGIPSIHMDFPEYRRLNAQWRCFVLLQTLSPELLADAIKNLLDNPGEYALLQANCHFAAKEWNWEKEKEALPLL